VFFSTHRDRLLIIRAEKPKIKGKGKIILREEIGEGKENAKSLAKAQRKTAFRRPLRLREKAFQFESNRKNADFSPRF
jgi:hypothetical protein